MHFDELMINSKNFCVYGSVLTQYTGTNSIVRIPHGVRKITAHAFLGCRWIKRIIIADTVETIEPYAFSHCKELEAVSFGYGLKVIEQGCFSELEKLREVILTTRIQRIERMAFGNCHALKTLTFETRRYETRVVLQNEQDVLRHLKEGTPCHIDYTDVPDTKPSIVVNFSFDKRPQVKRSNVTESVSTSVQNANCQFDGHVAKPKATDAKIDLPVGSVEGENGRYESARKLVHAQKPVIKGKPSPLIPHLTVAGSIIRDERSLRQFTDVSISQLGLKPSTYERLDRSSEWFKKNEGEIMISHMLLWHRDRLLSLPRLTENMVDEIIESIMDQFNHESDVNVASNLGAIVEDAAPFQATRNVDPVATETSLEATMLLTSFNAYYAEQSASKKSLIAGFYVVDGLIVNEESSQPIADASIAALDLSERAYQVLIHNKHHLVHNADDIKVADLLRLSRGELLALPHMSRSLADELVEKITRRLTQTKAKRDAIDYGGNRSHPKTKTDEVDVLYESKQIIGCIDSISGINSLHLIVDVLRGNETKRFAKRRFNTLPCFGVLKNRNEEYIRNIIYFLEQNNYLTFGIGASPAVFRGTKANDLIFSESPLHLKLTPDIPDTPIYLKLTSDKKPVSPALAKDSKSSGLIHSDSSYLKLTPNKASVQSPLIYPQKSKRPIPRPKSTVSVGEDLFRQLKALRLRIADQQGKNPHAIFADATLVDMCKRLPMTAAAFMRVTGISEAKMADYGNDFIEVISQYASGVEAAAKFAKKQKNAQKKPFGADAVLYKKLDDARTKLGMQFNVPAAKIISDSLLRELYWEKPLNKAAFLRIDGMTESRYDRYGEAFLDVIRSESGNQREAGKDDPSDKLSTQKEQSLTRSDLPDEEIPLRLLIDKVNDCFLSHGIKLWTPDELIDFLVQTHLLKADTDVSGSLHIVTPKGQKHGIRIVRGKNTFGDDYQLMFFGVDAVAQVMRWVHAICQTNTQN